MSYFQTARAGLPTGNRLFSLSGLLVALTVALTVFAPAAHAAQYAGIVVDANTGKTLYANSADELRYPASLTKMMTLYLTFEALEAGKISKSTRVPVSAHAAAEPPTKLGLRPGGSITVEQAILGLITLSANDAATALGEFLGGSEGRFAQIMTNKARALGMSRTTFRNANGLPNPNQVTTARDMARLGIALREHFPQYYGYFSTQSFKFGNRIIRGHNRLLGSVAGVDGIKTGYTRASGFNLVTSLKLNGRSVVGVVLGGASGASRNKQMRELLATYLPKASTRDGGNLIAQTAYAPTLTAQAPASDGVDLPRKGPVPDFRATQTAEADIAADAAEDAGPVELAYAKPAVAASASAFPVPGNRPVVGRDALIAGLEAQREQVSGAPATEETVAYAPAPARQPQDSASAAIDSVTTASTPRAPSGWVIQIGATPDQASAQTLLAAAKAKAGKALARAEPFTVAYGDGGSQVYRARFGGFDDKDSAWAACTALKKKGYGCWATAQ